MQVDDEYLAEMPRPNFMVLEKLDKNIKPLSFKNTESSKVQSEYEGKINIAYIDDERNVEISERF